jgi:AcrR family transcriptional regulator
MDRDTVAASQRARMLEAMAEAVAERGYASVTVADVVARAGVSRKTFYEHFSDKEACFLAAYDLGAWVLLEEITGAFARPGTWEERMDAGARAFLETLAAYPSFARTFLLEAPAAGPAALERRAAVHARYAELLRAALKERPDLPEPSHEVALVAIAGINEVVAERIRSRGFEGLEELLPLVLYVEYALLTGRAP